MESLRCNKCGADNKITTRYCTQCGYELPKNNSGANEAKVTGEALQTKKSKRLAAIAGVTASVIASFVVQQIFFKTPSVDELLAKTAIELNKTCPVAVDEYSRLDSAVALPERSFQYYYTLINLSKSEVNIDTVKKYVEPTIIDNIRKSPELKYFRDNNTTMIYTYYDNKGEFVHQLSVTPDMYKE